MNFPEHISPFQPTRSHGAARVSYLYTRKKADLLVYGQLRSALGSVRLHSTPIGPVRFPFDFNRLISTPIGSSRRPPRDLKLVAPSRRATTSTFRQLKSLSSRRSNFLDLLPLVQGRVFPLLFINFHYSSAFRI